MKNSLASLIAFAALALVPSPAAETPKAPAPARDESFRHEIDHAIDRGLAWLRANQNSNGWWSSESDPALTALAVAAILGEPTGRNRTNALPEVRKACAYLVASARPDGSIHRGKLANYNTALSMTALALTGDSAYDDVLRRGRAFLVGLQNDFDAPAKVDSPFDGGIGYGDHGPKSDLINTLTALEALRATEFLVWNTEQPRDPGEKKRKRAGDLNWEAAIHFIESCQNFPGVNTQSWVSTDPKDRGGFVYAPGESKAGGTTNAATGRVALRSYGSISYAGLLSYIYADVKGDDPRVRGVLDWLRQNYTLEENPGMGEQGLYYYFHLMTKGLSAAGVEEIALADGRRINWRREVAMKLLDLQQRDGSWVNRNNRWWEKDPVLVTAYSLLSLEIIARKM